MNNAGRTARYPIPSNTLCPLIYRLATVVNPMERTVSTVTIPQIIDRHAGEVTMHGRVHTREFKLDVCRQSAGA